MTSSVRPYRFIGETALRSLQDQIELAVHRWSQRWRKVDAPFFRSAVRVAEESDTTLDVADGPWLMVDPGQGNSVWLRTAASGEWLLGELLGERDADATVDPGAFSNDLGRALLLELALGIAGESSTPVDWTEQAPDVSLFAKASGAVSITLSSPHTTIEMMLSPSAVAGLIRPTIPQRPPGRRLEKLSSTVGAGQLPLRAQMEIEGGLSFHAVKDLAVGDVVLLDRPMATPWSLVNPEGALVAHCQVGQRDRRLVVQLLGR